MKKVLVFLIAIAMLAPAAAAAEDAPNTSAAAFAVYDATFGRFLAEGGGDRPRPMASTTKIMTALVALENFPADAEATFDSSMAAEGSSMYLKPGEKASLSDLLHGLMLMSGNDAARAIASLAEGGEEGFVGLMNAKAASLGLKNTSFANPNGLDADGHHTTAKELALLTAEAMKNETFREIVSTPGGVFAGRSMRNHNKLLGTLDGCVGVKTGYTTSAGRCLVSATQRDGRLVVVVTLHDPDDWADHRALTDWAFERYSAVELVRAGEVMAYLPVESGVSPQVSVCAAEGYRMALSDDELSRVETRLYLPRFVYAPVRAGESAGEAVLRLNGSEIARIPLQYDKDVRRKEAKPLTFGEKLKDWFETLAWKLGLC